MPTLKFSFYCATNKNNRYFYKVEIQDKEVYKSTLFKEQKEAQADAADRVSFFWLGGSATHEQGKNYFIFTFPDDSPPNTQH
jgi:hypothetical protein